MIPGHSKHDSLEAKVITLLTFLQGMLPLKKTTAVKSLSWSKGIFPQMIT